MKKLKYLMLGLAGLMMASCSQDDLLAPDLAEGNYIVTVKLPSNLGTRAVNMNTGYTANDLYYAVYDAEDGSLVQNNKTTFTEAAGGALETQVGLSLASGKSYKISFFACAPNNNVYTFDANAKTMTVNYEAMTSAGTEEDDIYDCFINLLETKEIGSDQMQASVTLYRPIAQINWGTSDLDEPSIQKAYGVNGQYILSNLSTKAYYTWDLLANDVDMTAGTTKVKYKEPFSQPQSATGLASFPVTGYKYVAMQYVLAPKTEAIYDLNLNINNQGAGNPDPSTLSSDVEVSSAPVQANFQTNIYGSLLTDNVIVNVVKSPAWFTPSHDPSLEYALLNGGTFTLQHDFVLDKKFTITNDLTIDLNGHTITGPGTGTSADDGMFTVDGATLNIKGDGTLETSGSYASILVWAMNNATVNIYGGTFKANAGGEIVYIGGDADGSTTGATVNIYGGTFIPTQESNGKYSLLNIYDPARNNSHMNVMGGTFYNWNPADNTAEGPNTNFVAPGYKSVNSTIGSENAYVVVPDGTTVVTTFEEAVQASRNGENVYLTCSVSGDATTGGYGNNLGGLVVKGNTVNGNGYTFDVTNESGRTNDYIIYTSGGVIENITLTSSDKSGFKGILGEGFSYDLTLNNVNVNPDANLAYAINFSVGNGKTINATDCTFCGWSSWGTGFKQLNFNNCYWGIGTYYSGAYAVLNGVVKPYSTTVFENCDFNEMIYMDLSELAADATVTFTNCTVNGVVLTKANHTIMKGYTLDDLDDWENYDKVSDRIFFN